ncbi:hypothetical protein GCM10027202_15650 [Microvirgula curvata]
MDIGSISAALAGIKGTVELTSAAIAVRDNAKIADALKGLNDRIIELQNVCIQAQEEYSAAKEQVTALKDERRELQAKIAELSQQADDRAHYQIHQLSDGAFVYAFQHAADNGTPMHYLCQPCMDNRGQKAILQREPDGTHLRCPECHNHYLTGKRLTLTRAVARSPYLGRR